MGANAAKNATSADQCIIIGYDAVGTGVMTGDDNTIIGATAGTNITSGELNIAIGRNAMHLGVVTGSNNIAIGTESGDDLTSGGSNVMMGTEAGRNINTGSQNTCIGHNSGASITTTSENTYVGSLAAGSGQSGNNVAVGSKALGSGGHGDYSVAMGWSAGEDLTGTQTTLIGGEAGRQATSTDASVAIGYNAMGEGATTGNQNTIVGAYAGKGMTSGSQSVFIGSYAGQTTTTGDYNICIGRDARTSSSSSAAQIVIGANLTGTTNNAVFIGTSAGHRRMDFLDDGTWDSGSDIRMKTNIEDSNMGLSFINKLRPVIFNWKSPSEFPQEWTDYNAENTEPLTSNTKIGLIAQEVKEAIDELGIEHYDGTWGERSDGQQEIGASDYVFPLIKAVQELTDKNEALEARLAALEG